MKLISINGRFVYHTNQFCADDSQQIIYLSIFSYQNNIDFVCKSAAKGNITVSIDYRQYGLDNLKNYRVYKYYDHTTDICHMVLLRKLSIRNDTYYNYYLTDNVEQLKDIIYKDISDYSLIPLLPEWCDYLMRQIFVRNVYNYRINTIGEETNCAIKIVKVDNTFIFNNIVRGLNNKDIFIENQDSFSNLTEDVTLDEYINANPESLTEKIQINFHPKFNPMTDEYRQSVNDFEDYAFNEGKGIQLFDAQKAIIAASVNNLDKEHVNIVVGECGTGKTCIGSGITYCHGKQLGYTAIVMCPAQLVEKWRREILSYVPNVKACIIENTSDIIRLDKDIKNKNKKFNLYLIMSQETAKFSYYEMPSVAYNKRKGGYICPKCGKVLTKVITEKCGRSKRKVTVPMTDTDFNSKSDINSKVNNIYCTNDVAIYDPAINKTEIHMCRESLWRPITKDEVDSEWIKIGSAGWFKKDRIKPIYNEILHQPIVSKTERKLLFSLDEIINKMDKEEELKIYSLYKYPVAKYIKNNYKGYIDYFVCDEVHEVLAKDSLQAKSFGDLSQVAKNNIALTGTLVNGYATSLFYLLYRLVPRKMKKLGFEYSNINSFLSLYGSLKTVEVFGKQKEVKKMPGVSPLLFSDFLLDICAFISLDDVADGLPGYQEIPVPVPLPYRIRSEYDNIVASMKKNVGLHSLCGNSKSLTQYIQLLYVYPDQPFGHAPIINIENNEIIYTPAEIEDEIDEKLDAITEIVKTKIAAGEKVLIYYHWSNKTDIKNIIKNRMANEGFNAFILETNTVAKKDREKWLKNHMENIDVLLCNPKLVETGLDLFDFTTIIYCQLGNKIFTMRQASRRSWRLGQTKDVEVYFVYYTSTVQQDTLALMASKLQASMAIEGKCSSEGLHALSANEDITTKITNSVLNGISHTINLSSFDKNKKIRNGGRTEVVLNRMRKTRAQLTVKVPKLYRFFEKSFQKKSISSSAIYNILDQKNVTSLF